MRRLFVVITFALAVGLAGLGITSSTARELTIAEKFGPNANLVAASSGAYKFDKNHSSIGFKVLHMGLVYVPGYFNDFEGTVNYDADDVTKSSVEFSAKTASVDTRVEGRNKHLRSADFFDVEKHPTMTFKSTRVVAQDGTLIVTGDFTLRGVTKSIMLPVKIAGFKEGRRGRTTMGAMANTKIKRSEFGVNYGIGRSVADEVLIELNIEAGMRKEVKK